MLNSTNFEFMLELKERIEGVLAISPYELLNSSFARFQYGRLKNICDEIENKKVIARHYIEQDFSYEVDNGKYEDDIREDKNIIYSNLFELIDNHPSHHTFVVLAESGFGKSALLKYSEARHLLSWFQSSENKLSLKLEFRDYNPSRNVNFIDFIEQEWSKLDDNLNNININELIKKGQLYFFIDAINELICFDKEKFNIIYDILYTEVLSYGNKVIMSCRNTYDIKETIFPLKNEYVKVTLKPFNQSKIEKYLLKRFPKKNEELFGLIKNEQLMPFYGVPFYLKILADSTSDNNTYKLPKNPSELFQFYIRTSILNEFKTHNSVFDKEGKTLFSSTVINFLQQTPFFSSELKGIYEQSVFFSELSKASYESLITDCSLEEKSCIIFSNPFSSLSNTVKTVAQILSIIEEQSFRLQFKHNLLQCFFAAIHIHCNKEAEECFLNSNKFEDTNKDILKFLLSFKKSDNSELINILHKVESKNKLIALECLPLVKESIDSKYIEAKRQDLGQIIKSSSNLKEREIAGRILGNLKGIGYKILKPEKKGYIPPPTRNVYIENDTYIRKLKNSNINIGIFPVTNYEFEFFIKDGGYEDEGYWTSKLAKEWLKGKWKIWIEEEWKRKRDVLSKRKLLSLYLFLRGTTTPMQSFSIQKVTAMLDETFNAILKEHYREEEYYSKFPRFWFDTNFNNPLQPVVGISWFEASAYCKWLSERSGLNYRLPTEWEWEAVAKGFNSNNYPHGNDENIRYYNISENPYFDTPTPIGILSEGKTIDSKCYDMCGNIFEWVDSLFNTDATVSSSIDTIGVYEPVGCRGGGWQHKIERSKNTYRGRGNLFTRNNDLGFRVLCENTKK
jgi:formylglycine-generating enzyme required for sulfatase activity